jgi:hypothetical protein
LSNKGPRVVRNRPLPRWRAMTVYETVPWLTSSWFDTFRAKDANPPLISLCDPLALPTICDMPPRRPSHSLFVRIVSGANGFKS